MLTDDLFNRVLVEPVRKSADSLYVVSGYANATMVTRHFELLKRFRKTVKVALIVGMAVQDGLSQKDHTAFRDLASDLGNDVFVCRYVAYGPPVHSKVYSWYNGDEPRIGFVGSANYTQSAFGINRREVVIEYDAEISRSYFDLLLPDTVDCRSDGVEDLIRIDEESALWVKRFTGEDESPYDDTEEASAKMETAGFPHHNVSLVDHKGVLPKRSGLN